MESIGCIYEELLALNDNINMKNRVSHAKKEQFSIQLSSTTNTPEMIDIEVCPNGCKSLFPYESFSHYGVRWDAVKANIECWCLTSDAFDRSMIGPQVEQPLISTIPFNQ